MLASTVQFSTNDQPTTHHVSHQLKEHNPQAGSLNGMENQVMPGTGKTTTGNTGNGCSFRYPTGCFNAKSSAAPTHVPHPTRGLY